MISWFSKIKDDIALLPDCIIYFENQLFDANSEVKISGNIEQQCAQIPGLTVYRFHQLQEVEAILKHLNIQFDKLRGEKFVKFNEHYNKDLKSSEIKHYIDSDDEVCSMAYIVNEFAFLRNKFLGILEGFNRKHWQLSNIVKIRIVAMEDAEIL